VFVLATAGLLMLPVTVRLLSVVVPVPVSPLTVGEVANTALPVPVVLEICVGAICPLLLPNGIPAHVPGVPPATFTQAATPFAVAPEFCSISPCDHVSVLGAPADFVAICISGPNTGAEYVSAVPVEYVAPRLLVKFTCTALGCVAFT
jgi:hypothetical protein